MSLKQYNLISVVATATFVPDETTASAALVACSLDNMFFDTGQPMTGQFDWTYTDNDFENSYEEFVSLNIPYTSHDHNDLVITVETEQIKMPLVGNFHDDGVDITPVLVEFFSPVVLQI
jgi:hypothetical protein